MLTPLNIFDEALAASVLSSSGGAYYGPSLSLERRLTGSSRPQVKGLINHISNALYRRVVESLILRIKEQFQDDLAVAKQRLYRLWARGGCTCLDD